MISDCLQILYLVHNYVALGTLDLLFTVVYPTIIVEFPILELDVFNPFISLAFQHLYFIIILNYISTLVVVASAHGPVFAVLGGREVGGWIAAWYKSPSLRNSRGLFTQHLLLQ